MMTHLEANSSKVTAKGSKDKRQNKRKNCINAAEKQSSPAVNRIHKFRVLIRPQ